MGWAACLVRWCEVPITQSVKHKLNEMEKKKKVRTGREPYLPYPDTDLLVSESPGKLTPSQIH